mgnify:CR=1 FL=1
MPKHASKRRHHSPSSRSSSPSTRGSPPSPKRRRGSGDDADEARICQIVFEALRSFQPDSGASSGTPATPLLVPLSASDISSDDDGPSPSPDLKGKYISREGLQEMLTHVRENMGFPRADGPSSSQDSLLPQFRKPVNLGLPIHDFVLDVFRNEWKDPEKIALPRFMAKLYPLEDMESKLPEVIHVDSVVASLVGRSSMAEENILKDPADKKVDSSLKKVFSGSHLALRAGVYSAYTSQSLISDFKALFKAVQDQSNCLPLLDSIESQIELLSDISFDVVRASALVSGASIAARRNLYLRDWNTDAAQRSTALKMPFEGSRLFGRDLEEKLHKLFKERKHSFSFRKESSIAPKFSKWKSFRQPSRRQSSDQSSKFRNKSSSFRSFRRQKQDPGSKSQNS